MILLILFRSDYPLRQIGISVPRFRLPWQYSDHACIEYAFRLILETDPSLFVKVFPKYNRMPSCP